MVAGDGRVLLPVRGEGFAAACDLREARAGRQCRGSEDLAPGGEIILAVGGFGVKPDAEFVAAPCRQAFKGIACGGFGVAGLVPLSAVLGGNLDLIALGALDGRPGDGLGCRGPCLAFERLDNPCGRSKSPFGKDFPAATARGFCVACRDRGRRGNACFFAVTERRCAPAFS